jgi:hypothetical protein
MFCVAPAIVMLPVFDELDGLRVVGSRLALATEVSECDSVDKVPFEKKLDPVELPKTVCPKVPVSDTLAVSFPFTAASVAFSTPAKVVEFPCTTNQELELLLLEPSVTFELAEGLDVLDF